MTPEQEAADILHGLFCHWNHTDGCSWEHCTWDKQGPSKDVRGRYLEWANNVFARSGWEYDIVLTVLRAIKKGRAH